VLLFSSYLFQIALKIGLLNLKICKSLIYIALRCRLLPNIAKSSINVNQTRNVKLYEQEKNKTMIRYCRRWLPSAPKKKFNDSLSLSLSNIYMWRHKYYSVQNCRTFKTVFIPYNLHFSYYTEKTSGHTVFSCIHPIPFILQIVPTQSLLELYPYLGTGQPWMIINHLVKIVVLLLTAYMEF
jgi:hypothetical protein